MSKCLLTRPFVDESIRICSKRHAVVFKKCRSPLLVVCAFTLKFKVDATGAN